MGGSVQGHKNFSSLYKTPNNRGINQLNSISTLEKTDSCRSIRYSHRASTLKNNNSTLEKKIRTKFNKISLKNNIYELLIKNNKILMKAYNNIKMILIQSSLYSLQDLKIDSNNKAIPTPWPSRTAHGQGERYTDIKKNSNNFSCSRDNFFSVETKNASVVKSAEREDNIIIDLFSKKMTNEIIKLNKLISKLKPLINLYIIRDMKIILNKFNLYESFHIRPLDLCKIIEITFFIL